MFNSPRTVRRPINTGVIIIVFIVCILATAVGTATIVRSQYSGAGASVDPSLEKIVKKLGEMQQIVDRQFVGEYTEEQRDDAIADAFVYGLGDQWSYYVSAADASAYEDDRAGQYVGVGILVSYDRDKNEISITEVYDDSPAKTAGLLAGDILETVDGEMVSELGYQGTVNVVRGEAGSEVTLTVLRNGTTRTFTMTRNAVKVKYIFTQMIENNIGYLRLTSFSETLRTQLPQAIRDLESAGATGIIFDVRNNPGGDLETLIRILDHFLPECDLFVEVDKAGNRTVLTANADADDIPLVVLCNQNSISAAEYFAACLQEYNRAEVIGAQTTGKGFAQSTFRLRDGSYMAISTLKYFLPSGKSLIETGISPDISIEMSDEDTYKIGTLEPEEDAQLIVAIERLKLKIR